MRHLSKAAALLSMTLAMTSLAGCGDGSSFFTLRLIGAEAAGGRDPITLAAVDQIRISLDPANNGTFASRTQMEYDGGDVLTHVSPAGEFVITVQRAYLERNGVTNTVGFQVDLPLTMEMAESDGTLDPGLFVEFIQRSSVGAETIGSFRRALQWPIEDGAMETVTVSCTTGFEQRCLGERP